MIRDLRVSLEKFEEIMQSNTYDGPVDDAMLGDTLLLQEWDQDKGMYTGRDVLVYMGKGGRWVRPRSGW